MVVAFEPKIVLSSEMHMSPKVQLYRTTGLVNYGGFNISNKVSVVCSSPPVSYKI